MGQREDMVAMWAEIRALKASMAQRPISANRGGSPDAVEITVRAAHSFTEGLAVVSNGTWSLLDSQPIYPGTPPYFPRMWGIVSAAGSGWFRVVLQGQAKVSGALAGYSYAFANGVATAITGNTGDPSFQTTAPFATSHADGYVHVCNDSMPVLKTSVGATFAVIFDSAIDNGNYVVYAGVPGASSPLALADDAVPWQFANVGIALFELGATDQWLILTNGSASYTLEGGDYRPAWLTTTPWLETGGGSYARMYLSESTPGQYATSEPTFKVYAGRITADYVPASFPDPATTTFSATAIGTSMSMHWDAITEKPAAFPPSGSITLNTNTTDTTNSNALTFAGSIGAQVWTMYEKRPRYNAKWVLSKDIGSAVGTVDGSSAADLFFWWDKTNSVWSTFQFFNPSAVTGWINVKDTTASDTAGKMTGVMAGTARSVFGRASGTDGLPAAITAGTDGHIFGRLSGSLVFDSPANFGLFTPALTNYTFYTTGSGNFTVPAGVTRIFVIIVGAGGGNGARPTTTGVGNTSTPTALYKKYTRQMGGAGGIVTGWLNCTPAASCAYAVGAAGTDGTLGGTGGSTNGGDTTFTVAGNTYTAGGGKAGYDWAGGSNFGAGGQNSIPNNYLASYNGLSTVQPFTYVDADSNAGIDLTNAFGGVFGSAGKSSEDGGVFILYA